MIDFSGDSARMNLGEKMCGLNNKIVIIAAIMAMAALTVTGSIIIAGELAGYENCSQTMSVLAPGAYLIGAGFVIFVGILSYAMMDNGDHNNWISFFYMMIGVAFLMLLLAIGAGFSECSVSPGG